MEHTKRQADIVELDDAAMRLRTSWRKMHNYASSLVKLMAETKTAFDTFDYGEKEPGYAWTFQRWLGFKAGLVESQVYDLLTTIDRRMAAHDRATMEAEQQRVKAEKRAEIERQRQERAAQLALRRQQKEDARQKRIAKREALAVAKQMEEEAKAVRQTQSTKNRDPDRNERSRRKIVAENGTDQLKEMLANGRLPLSTCERIARHAPDLQPQEIEKALASPYIRAHPNRQRPQPAVKKPQTQLDSTLKKLTAAAHQAKDQVLVALALDTVEARRERVYAYGAAILAIRDVIRNDRQFNAHLKAHELEVKTSQWRSDAMWLAANWDALQPILNQCPNMNPSDVHAWVRKHEDRFRDIAKPETGEVIDFPAKSA